MVWSLKIWLHLRLVLGSLQVLLHLLLLMPMRCSRTACESIGERIKNQ